jgi:elongation factor Tu
MKDNLPDFIAQLHYLSTAEGGRKTPVFSGYRPQLKFDFSEIQTTGIQNFINQEMVYPGETVEAEIWVLCKDIMIHTLKVGMQFEFREGARQIGVGTIKEITNKLLEA